MWKYGSDADRAATDMRLQPTTSVTSRYHPDVIWGPFVLALALGLVISAGLYFAYLWPSVEPEEPEAPEPPEPPEATRP